MWSWRFDANTGAPIHLLTSASPLFGEDGSVRGAVGAYFDVTSRKQLENLLRERADLLELASEAIMVRSLDGTLQFWNAGAEALYGWRREEVLGKNVHQILQTDTRAARLIRPTRTRRLLEKESGMAI